MKPCLFRVLGCWFVILILEYGVTRPFLWCQVSQDEPVEVLKPIEVTATRSARPVQNIPNAVSRIEKEEIQKGRPTLTLDESLSILPGVFFQNPYNFAQDLRISIRGFGARSPFGVRGIKILVDDIPQTLPDGISQLDTIDPGNHRPYRSSFAVPLLHFTATPLEGLFLYRLRMVPRFPSK